MLEAPILPVLLRLAAPGIILVIFQSAVSIADTYFIGRLGTEPLAGVALVFPLVMLLQMISAGAMGGGVSSAVARALGGGNERQARSLVVHAAVIAVAMGLLFTLLLLAFGSGLFRLLGGKGTVLALALEYSDMLFAGATLVWLSNTCASLLRGSGNTLAPALALIVAAFVHIPLSAGLVLGAGGLPSLGIAGAAVAYLIAQTCGTAVMAAILWRSALRPRREDLRLQARLFREILRVGVISSLNATQTVLTSIILTGLVGRHGTAALAGYGVGLRLELLQVPLVFAVGQALVVMVATHIGAGRAERAKRIAWTGALLSSGIAGAIGLGAAFFPEQWVRLFSADAGVIDTGSSYLRIVGPLYPLFGLGVALYFASQGSGRVAPMVLAGTARLAIVIAGGAAVVALGVPLTALFSVIAVGMLVYGTMSAWAVHRTAWIAH
jgi:putative MATE family efflux protein